MSRRVASFCFDDGFRATAGKVRHMFGDRGIAATFCVLAAPELAEDPYIRASRIADWEYWREARDAGHDVAPHGYAHERLDRLPLDEALAGIGRTWDVFARELPGFQADRSLFHLAYLAAPQPVVSFLGSKTLGVRRSTGHAGLNGLQSLRRGGDVDCLTFGASAADALDRRLGRFMQAESGWLVLVLHGLDGEGYGPVPSSRLERALDRLLEAGVDVEAAGSVMAAQVAAGS